MSRLVTLALTLGTLTACSSVQPIGVGADAPDFNVVDLATGDSVSFREHYAGEVTLVNIWATWCGPCKEEIPALDSLMRSLGPAGLRIAAVSVDVADSSAVSKWIGEYNVTFDILHDQSGSIQQIYRTTGVPESYLVGKDGKLVRIIYGAHPWASISNHRIIEQLLAAEGNDE
jgi:cytochrome c biogenesis protein CcmG/thiol:disulfide interchange protein DsbE